MPFVLDLDGVVWLAEQPLPGAADAVARLRAAGERVVFVTNNSSARLGEQEAKLARAGIPADGDVVTSALAAASLLEPGATAFVVGGPGVVEALASRDVKVVDRGPADAVVVGLTKAFDYELLRRALDVLQSGARLIGTNDDPTYPTPEGAIPGGGALLAAVATASGQVPEVAGKPHPPMAAMVRALVGDGPHTVVGDRDSTDGAFARALGARFALVLSGVTTRAGVALDEPPDLVAPDLAGLVDELLGR